VISPLVDTATKMTLPFERTPGKTASKCQAKLYFARKEILE